MLLLHCCSHTVCGDRIPFYRLQKSEREGKRERERKKKAYHVIIGRWERATVRKYEHAGNHIVINNKTVFFRFLRPECICYLFRVATLLRFRLLYKIRQGLVCAVNNYNLTNAIFSNNNNNCVNNKTFTCFAGRLLFYIISKTRRTKLLTFIRVIFHIVFRFFFCFFKSYTYGYLN